MRVAGDDQAGADARRSAREVLVKVEARATVHLEQRTGSRRGFEDAGPVETQWIAAVDDPAGRVGQDIDVRVLDRSQGAPRELVAGLPATGVDAGDHHVESRQQLVRVIERRIGANLELGPVQNPERPEQRVDARDLGALFFDPVRREAARDPE